MSRSLGEATHNTKLVLRLEQWTEALHVALGRRPRRLGWGLTMLALTVFGAQAEASTRAWVFRGPYGGNGLALSADSADPPHLLAGTAGSGVFKSTDGGATWSPSGLANSTVSSLVHDPSDGTVVYAGTSLGVFKTTDGGATWSPSGLAGTDVRRMWVDPATPSRLFALTNADLYRSTDSAATWTAISDDFSGGRPKAFALDPSQPSTVYASVFASGFYRSLDGGTSWSLMAAEPRSSESLAVVPAAPTVLLEGGGGRIRRSTDSGATWTEVLNDGFTFGMYDITVDPQDPLTVFAGGRNNSFKSTDGGVNWQALPDELQRAWARKFLVLPSTVLVAAEGGAVLRSADGGLSWSPSNQGITDVRVRQIEFDPSEPSTVWLATENGVFHSTDGGVSWQPRSEELKTSNITSVTVNPFLSERLWLGAAGDLGVPSMAQTVDGAATWVNRYECGFVTFGIAYDPLTAGVLYASSEVGGCKSADGGTTWAEPFDVPGNPTQSFAFDPLVADTLYVPGFRSVDGGATWDSAASGLVGRVYRLRHHPSTSGILYAASIAGVFATTDGGASWTSMSAGLPAAGIRSMAVDWQAGPRLVAGSEGAGVWSSNDGGGTWTVLGNGLETAQVRALAIDPARPWRVLAGTHGDGVFELRLASTVFAAGFETGDTSEWTVSAP